MNMLDKGREMENVYIPQVNLPANYKPTDPLYENSQIGSSCVFKYLGVKGVGRSADGFEKAISRNVNAVPYLAYSSIYKNYYSNKQEENGYYLTNNFAPRYVDVEILMRNKTTNEYVDITSQSTEVEWSAPTGIYAKVLMNDNEIGEPIFDTIKYDIGGTTYFAGKIFNRIYEQFTGVPQGQRMWIMTDVNEDLNLTDAQTTVTDDVESSNQEPLPSIESFDLNLIDELNLDILQSDVDTPLILDNSNLPVNHPLKKIRGAMNGKLRLTGNQEGLYLKTYQSDRNNNWLNTEWIDGSTGVNQITAISTTGDQFTIDALNLANRVKNLLDRVSVSGGTVYDYIEAAYDHKVSTQAYSPVYVGSLIKNLGFQEVVSNSESNSPDGVQQPLGTLAGRGQLYDGQKGGKVIVKAEEWCIVQGILSITPIVDYSTSNDPIIDFKNFGEFHTPDLSQIGFQDLLGEQLHWADSQIETDGTITRYAVGKQPAYINYMTDINECYGNFAEPYKEMFMTNNRRYEADENGLLDATTYIDPSLWNNIFAQSDLSAQNFWCQVALNVKARRKMSSKVMPTL